jgi:hypothetical protein
MDVSDWLVPLGETDGPHTLQKGHSGAHSGDLRVAGECALFNEITN